nr:putative oxidoreductase [Quercus suber]
MTCPHGALVVFGSGPGVGVGTATLFAERGFAKVVLMSRNAKRLAQDAIAVRAAAAAAHIATEVYEIPVDAADLAQVDASLRQVDESLGGTPLHCVLFNAARTGKSKFFDFSPESLENDLKIAVVSLYAVASWAMPKFLAAVGNISSMTPSLLVTSGMLAKDPFPAMFSLATCKAGQYSLIQSLHKQYEPQGVHCGVIFIGGTVSADAKVTNPRNIAEELWKMAAAEKGKGSVEVTLMDPEYAEHTENREK